MRTYYRLIGRFNALSSVPEDAAIPAGFAFHSRGDTTDTARHHGGRVRTGGSGSSGRSSRKGSADSTISIKRRFGSLINDLEAADFHTASNGSGRRSSTIAEESTESDDGAWSGSDDEVCSVQDAAAAAAAAAGVASGNGATADSQASGLSEASGAGVGMASFSSAESPLDMSLYETAPQFTWSNSSEAIGAQPQPRHTPTRNGFYRPPSSSSWSASSSVSPAHMSGHLMRPIESSGDSSNVMSTMMAGRERESFITVLDIAIFNLQSPSRSRDPVYEAIAILREAPHLRSCVKTRIDAIVGCLAAADCDSVVPVLELINAATDGNTELLEVMFLGGLVPIVFQSSAMFVNVEAVVAQLLAFLRIASASKTCSRYLLATRGLALLDSVFPPPGKVAALRTALAVIENLLSRRIPRIDVASCLARTLIVTKVSAAVSMLVESAADMETACDPVVSAALGLLTRLAETQASSTAFTPGVLRHLLDAAEICDTPTRATLLDTLVAICSNPELGEKVGRVGVFDRLAASVLKAVVAEQDMEGYTKCLMCLSASAFKISMNTSIVVVFDYLVGNADNAPPAAVTIGVDIVLKIINVGDTAANILLDKGVLPFLLHVVANDFGRSHKAIEAISALLAIRRRVVEQDLVSDTNLTLLVTAFASCPASSFEQAVTAFTRLADASPKLAHRLAASKAFVGTISANLTAASPSIQVAVLQLAAAVFQREPDRLTLLREEGLLVVIEGVAAEESVVMVRNLANRLLSASSSTSSGLLYSSYSGST